MTKDALVFIGEYKDDDILSNYNYLSTKITCMVLNTYCFLDAHRGQPKMYSVAEVKSMLFARGLDRNIKDINAIINSTLYRMHISSLITYVNDENICIEDEGRNAYCDRRFDFALSSLMEAQKSNELAEASKRTATISLIIAVATLLVTVFSIFVNCHGDHFASTNHPCKCYSTNRSLPQ